MKKTSILNHVLTATTIAMLTLSSLNFAEAKRFGGGRTMGKSYSQSYSNRSNTNNGYNNNNGYNSNQNSNYQRQNNGYNNNQMQQPQKRSWMPALGGLAAGLGLGYLFSQGGGLGGLGGGGGFGGIFSMLMLAGLAFFAYRLFSRRQQNNMQPSMGTNSNLNSNSYDNNSNGNINPMSYQANDNGYNNSNSNQGYQNNYSNSNQSDQSNYSNNQIPNFDAEGFMRGAKVCFNRLQAAYDTANLSDIREFTSPEVFAECQMQIQERGMQQNITEVISLQTTLIDTAIEGNLEMVSVRFIGTTKENGEMTNFNEIWHFSRTQPKGWLLSGIEQN